MDSKPVEPLKDEKPEKKLEPPPTKKSDAACLDIIVNVWAIQRKMNGFKDNVWKDMDKIEIV
jgi:hypothetical protein